MESTVGHLLRALAPQVLRRGGTSTHPPKRFTTGGETMARPKGSGVFAIAFGILFAIVFATSFITDLRRIDRYVVFQAWLFIATVILVSWGANRVRSGDPGKTVGQDTINFVMGIIGATLALLALVTGP